MKASGVGITFFAIPKCFANGFRVQSLVVLAIYLSEVWSHGHLTYHLCERHLQSRPFGSVN